MRGKRRFISKKITQTVAKAPDYEDFVKNRINFLLIPSKSELQSLPNGSKCTILDKFNTWLTTATSEARKAI